MIINFRDNENNTKFVKVSKNQKIKDLKLKLSNECEDFDFYFNGKLLNSEKLLTDYEIISNSTIEMKNNLKGGLKLLKFADVSKETQTKKLECYKKKNLCPWRIVRNGLNLEGKCLNEECVAYKKTVIINKKFGRFDLIQQESEILCKMCNKIIEAKTCGFCGCSYCFSGKKFENGKCVNVGEFGNWIEVKKKCYERFDPKSTEFADWVSLTIYTEELL